MASFDKLALALQPHYSRFDVANRLLFTGHSHQAWPDCSREAQMEAWDLAAHQIDTKWGRTFEAVETLRAYLKNFYSDPSGSYSHAPSTHDLLVKWLSGLSWDKNAEIITTQGEFYSLFRQLKSLEQAGYTVHFLNPRSEESLASQLQGKISRHTKAIMMSRVFFETGLINQDLRECALIARTHNIPMLIDDYHGTNVFPISIPDGFEDTYWLIGGYKYLQWGEGNCFLRYPENDPIKPIITGWFSSFSTLEQPKTDYTIQFDPDSKYVGATFDGVSALRAESVVHFFQAQGLTPDCLKEQYHAQISYMNERFEKRKSLGKRICRIHTKPLSQNGGFLGFEHPQAVKIRAELLKKGVFTDARGSTLRFGVAPYITSAQIDKALDVLEEVLL